MNLPNIYNYKDAIIYLGDCITAMKADDSKFSVRKWSKVLGINSPDILSNILKKKSKISLNLVKLFSQGLSLDSSEETYLEIMVKISNENSLKEKQILELILAEVGQLKGSKILVDDMNVFSHWVHMAILSLTRVKSIHCTKEMVQEYLLDSVPDEVVNESIDRLIKLNLVTINDNGVLTRSHDHTTSKNDAFQKSPHSYFEQVADLAKRGAQASANEREFQCFSLAINAEQIPHFKEVIRNFRAKIGTLSDTENANQVYQFNIQFFPLTKKVNLPQIEKKEIEMVMNS